MLEIIFIQMPTAKWEQDVTITLASLYHKSKEVSEMHPICVSVWYHEGFLLGFF